MSTANEAVARTWMDAFNAHDVERLISLYDERATHTSPKIRALHPETAGMLLGREALRRWWADAMTRLPGLRYELQTVTANGDRVFIEYLRHAPKEAPMPVAEVFEVRDGKIAASRVYHG